MLRASLLSLLVFVTLFSCSSAENRAKRAINPFLDSMGKRAVNPFMDSIGKRMPGFQPYYVMQKRLFNGIYDFNQDFFKIKAH